MGASPFDIKEKRLDPVQLPLGSVVPESQLGKSSGYRGMWRWAETIPPVSKSSFSTTALAKV
jgi:hypothetical protein